MWGHALEEMPHWAEKFRMISVKRLCGAATTAPLDNRTPRQ
ncbi:hypothetical protein SAZ_41685 [Streptomyces noursei ZPM]|nr:hypothetical protein SAZ_41685 [Streptomyces noursei ZPM]